MHGTSGVEGTITNTTRAINNTTTHAVLTQLKGNLGKVQLPLIHPETEETHHYNDHSAMSFGSSEPASVVPDPGAINRDGGGGQ